MTTSITPPAVFELPERTVLFTDHARGQCPFQVLGYTPEQAQAIALQAFELGVTMASGKAKKAAKPKAGEPAKPADVTDQTWADFLAVRKLKKAALTPTALVQITNAAAKAGFTLEAALQMCCERGWQAFRADWLPTQAAGRMGRPPAGGLGGMNYGDRNGDFN